MVKDNDQTQTNSPLKTMIITLLFSLLFGPELMAKEYRLVEVISDFFPRSEQLYLTLELDNEGNITHLKKQEYLGDVFEDELVFSINDVKSSQGVKVYEKDGVDVIWIKSKDANIEKIGGIVTITYLHNYFAFKRDNKKKSQSYRLMKDKSGEWMLSIVKTMKKINVMDFKMNKNMIGVPVGISQIEIEK